MQLGMWSIKTVFELLQTGPKLGTMRGLLSVRHDHSVFPFSDDPFFDIGEKRAHGVEVARGDGVELMIVALRATDSLTEPDRSDRSHSVCEHAGFVIFRLGAPFFSG